MKPIFGSGNSSPLSGRVQGGGNPSPHTRQDGGIIPTRIVTGITVLCLALVLLPVQTQAQSKEQGIRLYKEALHLHKEAQSGEDLKKAVEKYENALGIFEKMSLKKGVGAAANRLAQIWFSLGQYDKAVTCYEKALALFREMKDPRGEGIALNNLGNVFKGRGAYDKAVTYYEKSLPIRRKLKDRRGEGQTLNNLGAVFADWGGYDKAVSYYEESLAIKRELKDLRGEGKTLNNLGAVFAAWGQYDKAISYYEKSLAIFRELKDRLGEGKTLCNVGVVYAHRGERNRAKETIEAGLADWAESKISTKWPKDLIANLYLDEGDLRKAEPIVSNAGYWSTRGRFYLLQSDFEKAKTHYDKLRESAEKNRNADDLFAAYTGLGLSYEGMKNNQKASKYFRKAVAFTEELRTSLTASEREKFFDVTIGGFLRTVPYEGLARVLMHLKKARDALKTSEFTRARVFAESISKRAKGTTFNVPQSVLTADKELNDRLAALKKQRQTAYEKNNKLQIETLEPQINQLTTQREAHIMMLREKYPLFAATTYPEPMDISETALKPEEWVLAYDVTDPGLIVYLTHGKGLKKAIYKHIPRKEIDELVRRFREPLTLRSGDNPTEKLRSFDFKAGKKLTDILLADMLAALPPTAPIIIVVDHSLGALPFEMLVLNEEGSVTTDQGLLRVIGAKFFGDRNPVSYTQSITALTLARTYGKEKQSGRSSSPWQIQSSA